MLAPAFNFGEKYEKVLRAQLPPQALKKFEAGGIVKMHSDYGEFPLIKRQFEDMKQYSVTFAPDSISLTCPVRIIHGIKVSTDLR